MRGTFKVIMLVLCIVTQKGHCQELVEKIDASGTFSTHSLFLYDDSTFVFLNGSDTYLNFTTGKIEIQNGTQLLVPDSTFKPNISIEITELDSCSNKIEVDFLSKEQIEFASGWILAPQGTTKSWNSESDRSLAHFHSRSVMELDTMNLELLKSNCNNHEVVLADLKSFW